MRPSFSRNPATYLSTCLGSSGPSEPMHTQLIIPKNPSWPGWVARNLFRVFAGMVMLWPALLWGQQTPKLSAVQNMNFGNVNAVTGGGTVVMSTGGGLTFSGVTPAGGTVATMQVNFNGKNPNPYIWQNVPASASLGGGITVDTWTSTPVGFSTGGPDHRPPKCHRSAPAHNGEVPVCDRRWVGDSQRQLAGQ